MRIDTKYDFNQEMWFVDDSLFINKAVCPVCRGHKTVMLAGKWYTCPECYGLGREPVDVIGGHVSGVQILDDGFTRYFIKHSDNKTYSIPEASLFLTESEAQAEADRLNEERKQVAE